MRKCLSILILLLPLSILAQDNVGIGIELEQDALSGQVIITKVLEDSAAEKAGLLAGDEILSVDEEATEEMNLNELISLIKGKPQTKVWFWIFRGNKEMYVAVLRE